MSWVHGTKLAFFESRAEAWKAASEKGYQELLPFYNKVTNLYILKYGYNLNDEEDLDIDTPDPTDPDATLLDSENLTQEEADRCSEYVVTTRKVRLEEYGKMATLTKTPVIENCSMVLPSILWGGGKRKECLCGHYRRCGEQRPCSAQKTTANSLLLSPLVRRVSEGAF